MYMQQFINKVQNMQKNSNKAFLYATYSGVPTAVSELHLCLQLCELLLGLISSFISSLRPIDVHRTTLP